MKTFKAFFSQLSEQENARIALAAGDETYTYAQLDKAADLFASDLIEAGLLPGDHVGIWSFNSANWLIAMLGIVRAGGVAILGNYSMTYPDIRDLLVMTDVSYLCFGTSLASVKMEGAVEKMCGELKLPHEKVFDITAGKTSFLDRMDETPKHKEEIDEIAARPEDASRDAVVIFTTGTTSLPKAVLLNQKGFLISELAQAKAREDIFGEKVCVGLPLFHVFGLHIIFTYFLLKKTVYLEEKIGAEQMIGTTADHDITDLATVASVYLQIIKHPDFPGIAGRVHVLTTAGGALTPVQYMKLETAFADAKLFNEYGQTEMHGLITLSPTDTPIEKRAHSLGKPYPGEEIRIYDEKQKCFVETGEIGEIVIRDDSQLNGYYKLPPEKQAVDADGWLHTGDLGYLDEEGFLHMAGRIKDIIIKNGENIAPLDVESAVTQIDAVSEVKVFGAPHPIFGESVECCITLRDGSDFDEDAVKKSLKKTLTPAKIPSHFFVFPEFPLAPSGKLDQRGLKLLMLRKLRVEVVKDELEKGIVVADLTVKNTSYNIMPVTSLVKELSYSMGYGSRRVREIVHAVEEMLMERIINAYEEVGDIRIRIIFQQEWMRVEFSDSGNEYYIEKNKDTSASAKIILKVVDNFATMRNEKSGIYYCMDFLYEDDFSIKDFIISHDREVK
uniref:class I adenylate-forming enzyme family protein n=1 Tax=Eubacterium cellulosolvens TaxID=29322 RepID=UPI0004883E84|nr:class I adenylate-forming enzyme family protein [[Eubacterium] cellulosolvens]